MSKSPSSLHFGGLQIQAGRDEPKKLLHFIFQQNAKLILDNEVMIEIKSTDDDKLLP